jgi:cell fate (sporulation/competence/biofilm development) regulator YlbF (YheA/YmcA/DUF963 family)
MNVYDKAYELKSALAESQEVKNFREAFEKIKANPQNRKMLEDYRTRQMEIQAMEYSAQKPDEEKLSQLERLQNIISINIDIKLYLEYEYRLAVLMDDINRIISESIGVDLNTD